MSFDGIQMRSKSNDVLTLLIVQS